ncbi:MAG: hypothetical protein MHMPM18_005148, partial [Marteilia pararefringens]
IVNDHFKFRDFEKFRGIFEKFNYKEVEKNHQKDKEKTRSLNLVDDLRRENFYSKYKVGLVKNHDKISNIIEMLNCSLNSQSFEIPKHLKRVKDEECNKLILLCKSCDFDDQKYKIVENYFTDFIDREIMIST